MTNHSITKKSQLIGLIFVILTLFIDTLLFSIIIPIIPGYTIKLGVSQSIIGFLFSSYAVGLLVTTPFWGVLSDKLGRRIPILIGLTGFVFSTLFFAFSTNIYALFTARTLQGIASAASMSSCLALLADFYPSNERGKIMGFALSAMSIGSLIGAPIGGVLYDLGGYKLPFLAITALVILDAIIFIFLVKTPQMVIQEKTNIYKFLRNPNVLITALIVLLGNAVLAMLDPIFPVFLEKNFNLSSTAIGLMFGAATVAYAISSPFAGILSDKFKHSSVMTIGLAFMGLTLPILVLSKSVILEALAMFLVGTSVSFALSPTLPATAKLVDEHEGQFYATAYAIFDIFYGLGMVIGPASGGFLADKLGIQLAIFLTSGLLLIVSLLLFIRHKQKYYQSKLSNG